MDYRSLKSTAARLGLSPYELLALRPQNDPFYVGAPKQLQKGKWFASIYEAMGKPERCHIRRVHYWLVTTKAIAKPNGLPYENTARDWDLLCLAAKYARYLGLVPIENIVDRRNPEPYIHALYYKDRSPSEVKKSIDTNSIIDDLVKRFWCYNPCNIQAYMLECFCEKSTMNDVLEPLCEKYGMNLVTGLGELSINSVYLLATRIAECRKPVRIFYVSDFDPAGECMPVSVARKIEYFVRTHNLGHDTDVKLIPVMLTSDQCEKYSLPRAPIKNPKNDNLSYIIRKENFQARHGEGATELDAMEALFLGEMAKIIEEAITPYFDAAAWNEVVYKNNEIKAGVRRYLVGGECEECYGTGVDFQTILLDENGPNEYSDRCEKCRGSGSLPGKFEDDFLEDLNTIPLDSYSIPYASTVDDSTIPFLYDSSLEYSDQLSRYRQHQHSTSEGAETIDVEEL